ncbi:hypothetical protein C8Q72DRAFT_503427 [Fomitopsis betulina]|nr:hypothetical protein C8Q72DRAFT_503427 [Fomitopsis betulina]
MTDRQELPSTRVRPSPRLSRLNTATTAQSPSSATTPTLTANHDGDRTSSGLDADDVAAAYQDLANSQASLLRATTALEETFARMRSLRDHIAARRTGSSATTTTAGTQTQRPDASMRPNHNAIVLSDSEPERRRATTSELLAIIEDLRAELDPQRPDGLLASLREGRAALDQPGPRMATAGDDQLQTQRTSLWPSTAPFRFTPRPESSTGSPRPPPRRAVFESHLRADSATSLGRRVAARAAGGTSGSSRVSFSSLMEDLRRERSRPTDPMESLNTREQDTHRITQQNAAMNSIVQEARALGIPIDEGTSGSRPAGPPEWSDFPSPLSSSWSSPIPDPLAPTGPPPSISHTYETSTATLDMDTGRRDPSESDTRPTFAEQMAQLNAEMERQRERQAHLFARISARQSASASTRDDARVVRPPGASSSSDSRALDRLATAYENYTADRSNYETLRAIAMRDPAPVTNEFGDIEDDDPFSWLMPSRTPVRVNRSIWPTSRDRLPQDWSVYPASQFGTITSGRPRRDRTAQTSATAAAPPGRNEGGSSARHRRRGWARLDHDGNEIPTDEEEEYERNRSQMRTRAMQISQPGRLRQNPSTTLPPLPPPPPQGRRLSSVLTTQGLFWPGPTSGETRVRIDLAVDAPGADLDQPLTPRDESDEEEYWRDDPPMPLTIGSSAPFVPSLLPLPKVDLASTRKAWKQAGPIRIADPMPIYCAGR